MKKIRMFAFADEAGEQLDQQIAAMQRNHLDGLEIRNVDGANISDLSCEKAREIHKKLEDAGLTVWSVGSPLGKIDIETDDFAAHCEKFRHTLELSHILGAENIRLFSFYIPKGRRPEDFHDEVIDRLGQFCELAKGSGIALCHENEKGIYGDTAPRCRQILDALPDLYGVFDPANFVQCHQDTAAAWELLQDRIRYLHIKDALPDGSVVPAGYGQGKVAAITEQFLLRGGYAFTLEPHLTVFDGLSSLERSGEESRIGQFQYPDADTAFDAACSAFRRLLPKES
ncbi:MAG: sugar phosphate isomerase/epimerase family protein [Fusicatenibacter sp.]|nr:sugar phosphate isomerase/epimerase [Fusicatenibacter sp.]